VGKAIAADRETALHVDPVYRIGPGGRFDIPKWRGMGGVAYTLSAEAGVLMSSRGDVY